MDPGAPEPAVIPTARLDLVPLLAQHADEMARVLSDQRLYSFTGGSPPTAAQLRSRYERWVAGSPDPAVTWLNWVIRLREEACLTGTVQATITASDDGMQAEVAWIVGTPWQGLGIATEAARGLVGWLSELGARAVTAHIHPDHHASAAVAAAVGLSPTAELHHGEVLWRGEGLTRLRFGQIRSEPQ
jgi:RimJ/RimL family protein N-acetyltransferase